eukprot:Trichotokara_eunicae@DN3946_c0_g1_i1.p1
MTSKNKSNMTQVTSSIVMSVTVTKERALVTREISFSPEPCVGLLELKGLPEDIIHSTVRVKAISDTLTLHERTFFHVPAPIKQIGDELHLEVQVLLKELEEIDTRLKDVEAKKKFLAVTSTALNSHTMALVGAPPSMGDAKGMKKIHKDYPDGINKSLEIFRQKSSNITKLKRECEKSLDLIHDEFRVCWDKIMRYITLKHPTRHDFKHQLMKVSGNQKKKKKKKKVLCVD